MDRKEIEDFLEVEFSVIDSSNLSERDRYVAYERLKHKLIEKDLTPQEYVKQIINLLDHLEI